MGASDMNGAGGLAAALLDAAVLVEDAGAGGLVVTCYLATGLAIRACQAGHRVAFATAADWVARLADAHHGGQLQAELTRLGRYPLIVVDEVG